MTLYSLGSRKNEVYSVLELTAWVISRSHRSLRAIFYFYFYREPKLRDCIFQKIARFAKWCMLHRPTIPCLCGGLCIHNVEFIINAQPTTQTKDGKPVHVSMDSSRFHAKKDLSRFLGLLISRIYIYFIFQNKTWQQGFTLPIEDLRIKHLTVENKIN